MQRLSGRVNLLSGATVNALSSPLGATTNLGVSHLQVLSGGLLSQKRIHRPSMLTQEPMSLLHATMEVQFWGSPTVTQNGFLGDKSVWLARIHPSVRSGELFGS